ncbi:GAF domain-containing sensor histidine kinase [Candidatus Daviesbacteria bacterium]|nr:GAF domain-containing sensor histidine kinase [Candidatus Daviesbacteria bacterium]
MNAPAPPDEKERLASLHALGLLDTPTEERFDRITKLALALFNVPISTITLIDSHREWFKSYQGLDKREGKRAVSFCGHALLEDDIFVIPDTKKDPRFSKNPMVLGKPFIRFYAGVPLKSADGKRIGVFCIKDTEPRSFNQNLKFVLKNIAYWVELELNTHELSQALEARRTAEKQVSGLNEILRLINKTIRHDILNYLTVLKANIDLFLNKRYGKEILQDAYQVIDRSVQFMRDMKDLEAAVSTGTSLKPCSLKQVIKEASKRVPFLKYEVKGDGKVYADQALISVIENIARNALIHAKTNKIYINIFKNKNHIQISLANKGINIPDKVKDKLFKEGVTYGETGNSGLGLYIARKTIERYGGIIWVTDNKPKGAKFIISLPIPKPGLD